MKNSDKPGLVHTPHNPSTQNRGGGNPEFKDTGNCLQKKGIRKGGGKK